MSTLSDFNASSLSFSLDGKILSYCDGSAIRLLSVEAGQEIFNTETFKCGILSPDGKTLVFDNDSLDISLWDVETGEEIRTLGKHSSDVGIVSFRPDGKLLASGGNLDPVIKLWDMETGEEILTLKTPIDLASISFSPDGKLLASSSSSGIQLWNLDLDYLVERSCDRVRNYLKYNPKVTEEDRRLCDGI
ncbi:MAG: WD40 repeat domain-containing protein [Symploca sp. SIO3E6]|nr:WD40 repeat domain-containing protein [Caldora sp. SIO3E6]